MELRISRKIDDLGRFVIPKEMRDALGWDKFTEVSVAAIDGRVILEKSKQYCCICNKESENMIEIEEKYICKDCAKKIRKAKIK